VFYQASDYCIKIIKQVSGSHYHVKIFNLSNKYETYFNKSLNISLVLLAAQNSTYTQRTERVAILPCIFAFFSRTCPGPRTVA